MNQNEYGIVFYLNMAYTMSGYTALSLTFTRPDGTTLTVANPSVTLSASPLSTPLGTFAANQYVQYTFVNGDINQAGVYSVRARYTGTGVLLISDVATFVVKP